MHHFNATVATLVCPLPCEEPDLVGWVAERQQSRTAAMCLSSLLSNNQQGLNRCSCSLHQQAETYGKFDQEVGPNLFRPVALAGSRFFPCSIPAAPRAGIGSQGTFLSFLPPFPVFSLPYTPPVVCKLSSGAVYTPVPTSNSARICSLQFVPPASALFPSQPELRCPT